MKVVLLGAPGAGKGTQCKSIVAQYNLLHLSSGDILRQERAEGSELGKKAQGYMDSGALVPDEIIIEMMVKAIGKAPSAGFILDGFPRTNVVTNRITGRRSCPECGAVYHIENLKPKTEGICDNDGTELVQRPDDTEEVLANRLETYHQQTEPLVDYYKKNGTVYNFEADRTRSAEFVSSHESRSADDEI